ncbi:multi antimicrobial extrusion protein MatE [Paenibacillus tarimensis]|uniref:multi antimicrobial extrusion protein MatE n=1 Tax=Paenibacillus tarimensis TaxID=416012 RepID=UPI001F1F74B8|nr:multi antimicrobial extrusion protein MatE [Paenibacillus tarimensis]MCF2944866.1 multi antimicrobial extrusion protein MatE [Paenibacillus tarimensis]
MQPAPRSAEEPDIRLNERVSLRRMLAFFVPLGLSASLVALSHVIVNGTLSRSLNPEATIAGYTIAMSLFIITERPVVFLRQTCSALAGDRVAFRAVGWVTLYLLLFTLVFGSVMSYSPLGAALFRGVYTIGDELVAEVLKGYRVLFLVTVFSAIRCLYHGIIIRNMQTKWLTIGMVVRLAAMYLLSLYFISSGHEIDGRTGALIFLAGMMVEALVSWLEGRRIYRVMPEKHASSGVSRVRDVFPFYRPLIMTSFLSVLIGPSINAMLGKTSQIELAIASYAIALSVTTLITSFYTYVHQIVLNFYQEDPRGVWRFALLFHTVPALLVALLAFTPAGPVIVGFVIGGEGQLLDESLRVLRVFVLFALVFPWVDFGNGLVMLRKQTRLMAFSQLGNVIVTVAALLVAAAAVPGWNGMVGALAQSCGLAAEGLVLLVLLRRLKE